MNGIFYPIKLKALKLKENSKPLFMRKLPSHTLLLSQEIKN